MFNDRPIDDPHVQEALGKIMQIYREYDLVGGAYLANAHEMAFGYALYSTFNAIVEDGTTPMGFRIRAKSTDLGHDRAQELMEGTAQTFGAMRDFGRQCEQWGADMMRLLRKAGVNLTYRPFGGKPLPHIRGL